MRRDQALRFFSSWDERNTAMMACAEFARRPSREGCRYCPTGEKAPPFDPPILLSFFVRLRSILLRTAPIPAASSRCATAIVTGEPMSRCVSSTAAETASPFASATCSSPLTTALCASGCGMRLPAEALALLLRLVAPEQA